MVNQDDDERYERHAKQEIHVRHVRHESDCEHGGGYGHVST